jgi:hypothetical protein
MMSDNKIVWEKWKDPLSPEKDEWFPDGEKKKDELEPFDESYEEELVEVSPAHLFMSNMGIIPHNPVESINKMFNFWTGHTNFSITTGMAHRMEKIEGVEVLDILTRYRFRIGVGKLFKDGNVMNQVQDTVRMNEE